MISEYWLLQDEECKGLIKTPLNSDLSEGNANFLAGNSNYPEGNANFPAIKESKGKERKVKQRVCVRMIEEFISAYPKSCNRHQTEIAYINLIAEGVELEENLVVAAQNYAESCKILGTQERYIKNAENFLKDFAFEEYLPGRYKKPERAKQNSFNDFKQNSYNFEQLESELIAN